MRCSLIVTAVSVAMIAMPSHAQSQPNWNGIAQALDAYGEYPSSENAAAAKSLIPEQHVGYDRLAEHSPISDAVSNALPMLSRQVQARDVEAVRLAFRLYSVSDGANIEHLDTILGSLIRPEPTLFLQELARRSGQDPRTRLPVSNLGLEFVDRIRAKCLELELRGASLEGVRDPSLRDVRDRSVKEIRQSASFCR